MTIPALPALDRTSPTFRSDLDTFFLTQLPATVGAMNAEFTRIDGITAGAFTGTSGTSRTIASSGSFTFGVVSGTTKAFALGQRLVIAAASAPSNQMRGYVTAYDTGTGELVVAVDESSGSGTFDLWSIAVTSPAASPHYVGDVVLTSRALSAPAWLPADGAIYSQSSYAALYAELGLLRDGITRPFGVAGTLAQNFGYISLPGEGVAPFPLLTGGSTWMAYNKAAGVGNNRLARSTDGGVSWAQATLPNPATDQQYTRVVSHNSGATLVAIHASTDAWVALSTDNGATWTTAGVAGYGGNGQLFVVNGTYVLLSAAAATAWTSTDGAAWTSRTLPAALTLLTVSNYNGSQVATAVTGTGPWTTLYTTSDGITWASNAIASVPNTHTNLTLVSRSGTMIWVPTHNVATYRRSTDGGATWTSPAAPSVGGTYLGATNGRVSVFDGRFVYVNTGASRAQICHSVDGLTWVIENTPIPIIDDNLTLITCVVGSELWIVPTSVGSNTVYVLSKWGAEWQSFSDPTVWAVATATNVQELNGVQMHPPNGTNQPRRRSVYTYNTATQFAVPTVPTPTGVTAYIKA
ncbi:MAG: hypothetical protein KA181_00135 [Xylophilus sp.]|nr:hypothetical protein [Xylophilus sp.]